MAKPHPEQHQNTKSTQHMEDAARHLGERAAEQSARAAEAGQEVARAGCGCTQAKRRDVTAHMALRLRSGDFDYGKVQRAIWSHARPVRKRGAEGTEATEHSARNAQALLYSGTAVAKAMGEISQRVFPDGSTSSRAELRTT